MEGIIRDRWILNEPDHRDDVFEIEEEMYEVETDGGKVFAESADNLIPASLQRWKRDKERRQRLIHTI